MANKNVPCNAAVECAKAIANYCVTRFPTDTPPHLMLDIPWFAEKVQACIDETVDHTAKMEKSLHDFLAYALTVKRNNTPEWLAGFAEAANKALEAIGSNSRVTKPKRWTHELEFELE